MKEKIVVLLIASAICVLLAAPTGLSSDTTVTGTFDATADLDVDVNTSAPDFGSIAVDESQAFALSATNNGNVTADVTQTQAVKDSGTMTLHTDHASLGHNQYGVTATPSGGSEYDIGDSGTHLLFNALAADAVGFYNLTVYIGPTLGATSYEDEAFSADLSVAADT